MSTWSEGIGTHKLLGDEIPLALKQLYDPPKFIFYGGAAPDEWLSKPKLGVVGSRKANSYGREITRKLTTEASQAGIVIISGLAFGIDSIAHQAALATGAVTVAVLPGPLDTIYPASHRQLAQDIIKSGGTLISEYASGSDIRKENFIARNRLIAGLADALLVPQAASHSGSLHTANFALEQGKTVMAVPGDIGIEMNAGSNNLLKNGAVMVTEASDIFLAMHLTPPALSHRKLFKASPAQKQLFELIGQGMGETEELAAATGLSSPQLSSALSLLEIDGYIAASNGSWRLS